MMNDRRLAPNRERCRPRRWPAAALAVLLAAMMIADREGWLFAKRGDDLGAYHGRFVTVTHVVSGDVIEVGAPDPLHGRPGTQVRLWGVRAPQPPRPGREPEPMWEMAIAHVESLALGREVMLRLESQRTRDPQGLLLAHVEIREGGTLNEALLRAALARRDERWPHMMLTSYAQAENGARRRGEGLWSEPPLLAPPRSEPPRREPPQSEPPRPRGG